MSLFAASLLLTLHAAPFATRTEAAAVVAEGHDDANEAVDELLEAGKKGLWALNALASKSRGAKKARVLEAIGRFRTEEAEYVLKRAIKSSDPVVRTGAIQGMGHISSSRVTRVLVDHLTDRNDTVRDAALAALIRIGLPVRERMLELLVDSDPRRRNAAMSYHFAFAVDPPVVERALADPSQKVVQHTIELIGQHRDRRFAAALKQLVESDAPSANEAAAAYAVVAPTRAFGAVVELVASPDRSAPEWRPVAEALYATRKHQSFAILAAAGVRADDDRKKEIRRIMTANLDPEHAGLLVGLLTSRHPGVSRFVGEMLAGTGEQIEAGAFAALPNAGLRAREVIAKLLVDAPRHRVVQRLESALESIHMKDRISALFVLERMAAEEQVPLVLSQVKDERGAVRIAAVRALAPHDGPAAMRAMLNALADTNAEVRSTALDALAHHPTPERINGIIGMLEADRQSTRLHAIELLSPPQSSRVLDHLTARLEMASPAERRAIVQGIAKADLPGTDLLMIDLVTHRSREVRLAASAVVEHDHARGL